ncbi:hypothetical protein KAR91_59845 [Candidatus Pacearchaeota archaeon]|nr:hypothetical protein [Candidatus Pacearchaeota archaeon]
MADAANAPVPTFPQTEQTRYKKAIWELNGNSTGKPVRLADYPDKTLQIYTAAGAATYGGATIVFEGSLDPTADPDHADYATSQWGTLTDTTETAISTGVKLGPVQVLQNPEWVRAKSTGGTATTAFVAFGGGKS